MPSPINADRHITRESIPAIPRLKKCVFIVLITSLKTKNAPYFDDAFQCDLILLLCVADIHLKGTGSGLLIPNPNIRDVGIFGVAAQVTLDVPFGVFALRTCGNGIVPAVHGFAVQRKTDTLGIRLLTELIGISPLPGTPPAP